MAGSNLIVRVVRMNTSILIVFYFFSVTFAVAGLATHVTTRFKSAVEGANVLIACRVNETASVGVYWKRNDVASTFRQNGTLLKLVNIRRASAGLYICYSYNKTSARGSQHDSMTVDKVYIEVLFPASVTNITISPTTLTENQTFTVTCSMTGNPTPSYMIPYFRNRTWYNTSSDTVTITRTVRAQCRDRGRWGCYARNKLNKIPAESQGINVTVLCSPRPKPWYSDMNYHKECGLGQSVRFEMDNLAYPPCNYSWSHDGVTLPATMHDDYNTTGLSILNISYVRIHDFGNYTLTMMNSVGTYVTAYQLLPGGPPLAPRNLTFYNVTKEGATINWVSGFDMWKHQQFVIYRYIHGGTAFASIDFVNDTSSNHGINAKYCYVVTGLEPGTNYTLVVASQSPGFVSYTNDISFKTLGSKPEVINGGSPLAASFALVLGLMLYLHSTLGCK